MSKHIETKCIQSGYEPKNGEPRVIPIVQSTTFKYETSEDMGALFDLEAAGFFYTRLANPTLDFRGRRRRYAHIFGTDCYTRDCYKYL